MKVAVCGLGYMGKHIAAILKGEGHDVVIIDKSQEVAESLANELGDVDWYNGDASLPNVQEKADISSCDVIFAVTENDQYNIVICQIAHSVFHVKKKIASLTNLSYIHRSRMYIFDSNAIPIDFIIKPEKSIARKILFRISYGFFNNSFYLENTRISCVSFCIFVNSPLYKKTYYFFREYFHNNLTCVFIRRDYFIHYPEDDFIFQDGDYVYCLYNDSISLDLFHFFHVSKKKSQNVLIAGFGPIGIECSHLCHQNGHNVSVVEKDIDVISRNYIEGNNNFPLYHSDILDNNFLSSINITGFDNVLFLTNNNYINFTGMSVMSGLGIKSTVGLYTDKYHLKYLKLPNPATSLILNPVDDAIDCISSYLRKGNIFNVHKVNDGEIEIVEGIITGTSSLVGVSLSVALYRYKNYMHIQCLVRSDRVYFFHEDKDFDDMYIYIGDTLVFLMQSIHIHHAERFFSFI